MFHYSAGSMGSIQNKRNLFFGKILEVILTENEQQSDYGDSEKNVSHCIANYERKKRL